MHPKLSSSNSSSSNRHLICGEDGNGVSFAAIPPDPRPWGLGPKFRNPSYGDVSLTGRWFPMPSFARGTF